MPVDLYHAGIPELLCYSGWAGLGKHKLEKSCIFVIKLADINMDVLAKRIRAELHDLDRIQGVHSK